MKLAQWPPCVHRHYHPLFPMHFNNFVVVCKCVQYSKSHFPSGCQDCQTCCSCVLSSVFWKGLYVSVSFVSCVIVHECHVFVLCVSFQVFPLMTLLVLCTLVESGLGGMCEDVSERRVGQFFPPSLERFGVSVQCWMWFLILSLTGACRYAMIYGKAIDKSSQGLEDGCWTVIGSSSSKRSCVIYCLGTRWKVYPSWLCRRSVHADKFLFHFNLKISLMSMWWIKKVVFVFWALCVCVCMLVYVSVLIYACMQF